MDEFIENFQDFREWLYSERNNTQGDRSDELETIIGMFEQFNLDQAF